MISKGSIVDQPRKKGLKTTSQRLAIIDVPVGLRGLHPGARLVYKEARKYTKTGFGADLR